METQIGPPPMDLAIGHSPSNLLVFQLFARQPAVAQTPCRGHCPGFQSTIRSGVTHLLQSILFGPVVGTARGSNPQCVVASHI